MKEKIIIKSVNGKSQFLEIDEIRRLLKSNNDRLLLVFENGEIDDKYRMMLQKQLPNHHVLNRRWIPEFWIRIAIETAKILTKTDDVYNAALSFRNDGIRLMKILGETYQFNPFDENENELGKLRRESRENGQRGKVNEVWNFWFHGAECQFKNPETGQIVELVITNGSEFGALDSYFFLNYLKTTPRFHYLAKFFENDLASMTKALDILEDLGKLERIDKNSHRGIIAKTKNN